MSALNDILHAFFLLLVIMGPFTGLPVFLKITQTFDKRRRMQSANHAIAAALVLLLFFLFLGEPLLHVFHISLEGFRIAGGIVLLLLGIEYMFHINFSEKRSGNYSTEILVPFAMPLIIGPGVIVTTIILTKEVGYIATLIGGLLALVVYGVFLHCAHRIAKSIGQQGIEVVARFMGLLLMAIAVDMMKSGVAGFIRTGLSGA